MVALIKVHPWQMVVMITGTLSEAVLKITKPLVLMGLLEAIADEETSKEDTYIWALYISVICIAYIITHHILFFTSMRVGWNWRTTTQGLVYNHLLSLEGFHLEQSSKGNLVNLISNDVGQFENFVVFMNFFWCGFLELIAILIILIWLFGLLPGLAGVVLVIGFFPLQINMGKHFASWRTITAARTDKRIRNIGESIEGIATCKSYGWETPFFRMIRALRVSETDAIISSQKLKALNKAFDYCMVPSCNLAMFTVYWAVGGEITLAKVFGGLLMLQVLRQCILGHWTSSIERGSEAIASCVRLEKFLNLGSDDQIPEELMEIINNNDNKVNKDNNKGSEEKESYLTTESGSSAGEVELVEKKKKNKTAVGVGSDSNTVLNIPTASFCYGNNPSAKMILQNINFSLQQNELIIVIGPVGAGKSSLLSAILGEMSHKSPSEDNLTKGGNFFAENSRSNKRPRIAYCAQIPWIFSATIKENVVVSAESNDRTLLDEDLFKLSMESCSIVEDLKQLPNGQNTEIGEKGVSISGGQKARLALARAVYSDADVYLLDDPLSAVDAHVSRELFDNAIVSALKKRGKSVILCTHQMQYLQYADKVLVLDEEGNQKYFGTYASLQKSRSKASLLEFAAEEEEAIEKAKRTNSVDSGSGGKVRSLSVSEVIEQTDLETEGSAKSMNSMNSNSKHEVEKIVIIQDEDREEGAVSTDVYVKWMNAGGFMRGVGCFVLILLSQGALMFHEFWFRFWVDDAFNLSDSTYLWILAILTPVVFAFGFYRSYLFFGFTILAASSLHENSLWSVMHSPLSFFTSNPTGRILNRFSKDQNQVDENLPVTFFDFLQCLMQCLGAVVLICISIPWMLILFPPLIFLFSIFRSKYMASMREIKRLEAITRSPIYAGFSATLDGLPTIRAYALQTKMKSIFKEFLNDNGRAWWAQLMVARWFGFRMDVEAGIVLVATAFFAVYFSDSIDPGLIGFTLVYSMNLSGLFQWTVRQSAEVETMMTGVERIARYATLPAEEGYETNLDKLKKSELAELSESTKSGDLAAVPTDVILPTGVVALKTGKVEIRNLSVTYRHDLAPVLNGLSMTIEGGSKCGIVGRTGSGKSTVLSALLRLNIIDKTQGSVILDDEHSLMDMSLESVRSLITIIPQQPHLFIGSLRFNLDPFDSYTDVQIWCALEDAHMNDYVQSDPLKLGMHVESGGNNFSVGQKQLLSLARAILRRSKVILMDEVTASVDYETDSIIQKTIRTSPALKDATIITVRANVD